MRFATATREELWLRGRCLERRISHGEAVEDEQGIVARDARDDRLVEACNAAFDELLPYIHPDLRIRLIAEASTEGVTQTIVASHDGFSVVTTPEHFASDVDLLWSAAAKPPLSLVTLLPKTQLWQNGTAAVLLHEAFGHPLEQNAPNLDWPDWLHVEVPLRPRRATFRDLPLLRMTTLTATQTNAPFVLHDERIEILLVDGGGYDPLTDVVTLRIAAADVVTGEGTKRLAPFEIHESRATIARSLRGATGHPIRYPGVVCSREGQELVVGSVAPLMLTELP